MAKATATKTKSASAQQPVENVVVSESVSSTEKKVKKVKSSASKEAPAPVVEQVVATPAVPAENTVVEPENNLAEKSMEFTAKLHQLSNMITSLKAEFKTMEKSWSKELKASQKLNSKRKRKSGNRAPSGFVKPAPISDELAKFLNKPVGSEMARTEVTREINAYIRAHNLKDAKNGRTILPDKKLATLLKVGPNDHLDYFNLQKFISPHFPPKSASSQVEAVAGGSA
jgi:upstream activation factor subunit UAF30